MITRLLSMIGLQRKVSAKSAPRVGRVVRARYDAAQTTDSSARHWAAADCLSARQANSPQVRQTLRNRARYEVANNSYARGIVNTLANHVIGTGPRLQVLTANAEVNRRIEQAFSRWSRAVRLADKLRTLVVAEVQDGEGFAQFITNERLPVPVKLDLKPIEAEQVATPTLWILDPLRVDGIRFDADGNPLAYDVLRYHPGDAYLYTEDAQPIAADQMIHLFRVDRPGQVRGVPEIMPALGLFAHLRGFTESVVLSAHSFAQICAVMQSTAASAGEADEIEPFAAIEMEPGAMLTLPDGWTLNQLKAEQPATTYQMFKREIIAEIARCLNMPYNIAAGDSSSYNYSSGRLDHQVYYADIDIRRSRVEADALDRVFSAWFDEAALIAGVIPEGLGAVEEIPHEWQWDAPAHIDEQKEANAQMTRLQSGMTSYQTEFAREGHDWETEQTRQAAALGMTLADYRKRLADALFPTAPQPTPPAPEDDEEDVQQRQKTASAA